jgi:hypothetical protein
MDDLWFEEEIVPANDIISQTALKLAHNTKAVPEEISHQIKKQSRGIIRSFKPRWKLLDSNKLDIPELTNNSHLLRYYLIRLGIEYEVPIELRKAGVRFTEIKYSTYIWAAHDKKSQPAVYEIYPTNIFEGEPQKMSFKIGPEFSVGGLGGSFGELGTDLVMGQLSPAIVGFLGENERCPYWVLTAKTKELLGTQYFWVILEIPQDCANIRLATRVDAILRTFVGPIPVGPSSLQWESRPSVIIP